MKFNLRLGDGHNLTRENAWACCTSNFALPGSGSLLAGRKIGYPQMALAVLGFGLTTWFGMKFIGWGIRHWSELMNPSGDPLDLLLAVWRECRWALAGLGCFATAWLWALFTSLSLLRTTRPTAASGTKPPLIR